MDSIYILPCTISVHALFNFIVRDKVSICNYKWIFDEIRGVEHNLMYHKNPVTAIVVLGECKLRKHISFRILVYV